MSLISYVVDFFTPASVKKRRADVELRRDTYSILESIKFLCGVAIGKAKRDGGLVYAAWDETHGTIHSRGMFTEVAPGVILVTHSSFYPYVNMVEGIELDDNALRETLRQYVAGLDGYVFQQHIQRGEYTAEGIFGESKGDTLGFIINVDKFNAFIKRTPNKGLRVSALRTHLAQLLYQVRKTDYKLPFTTLVHESKPDVFGKMTVSCSIDSLPYCDSKAATRIITEHFKNVHANQSLIDSHHFLTHSGQHWNFTFQRQPGMTFINNTTHCD